MWGDSASRCLRRPWVSVASSKTRHSLRPMRALAKSSLHSPWGYELPGLPHSRRPRMQDCARLEQAALLSRRPLRPSPLYVHRARVRYPHTSICHMPMSLPRSLRRDRDVVHAWDTASAAVARTRRRNPTTVTITSTRATAHTAAHRDAAVEPSTISPALFDARAAPRSLRVYSMQRT